MSDHLIVIPAFDEAATLGDVVARARRHGAVLVVDDGSGDDSAAIAAAAGADVVRLRRRRGKGLALRRGFAEALARGAHRVVTLDGDGQHDPDDIPRLLEAAAAAPDALVIGGRLARSGAAAAMPEGRLAALRIASFYIDWLTGSPVVDTQSGFRVYPAGLLAAAPLRRGGFVLETEVLLRAVAERRRLVEVPITALPAAGRQSRFRPVRDGVAVGAYVAGRVSVRWGGELLSIARALVRPFTAARRRPRHQLQAAFAAPHRDNPGAWAMAMGVFTLTCIADTWRGWWHAPRARCLRLVATATAATPLALGLGVAAGLGAQRPRRWLAALSGQAFSQDALARVLPDARSAPAPVAAAPAPAAQHDVLVIGAGPGGSTAAALLARGGLSVGLVEREVFPRFHVGESLLPANLPLLERLGVLEEIRSRGFITKYGASFHDQESGLEYTFSFRPNQPWPQYSYEVPRAEFDQVLLDHARRHPGVTVYQPAAVDRLDFDATGATASLTGADGARDIRARFVVDASGRDAFLASRIGRRRSVPGLGKVALFAHFRGARRWPGQEEGNIRIFIFDGGWFWWIPFAGDVTSIGCVLHARTVRGREGSVDLLYDAMIERCERVAEGVAGAQRITPVRRAANFSYQTDPVAGDRFVCVGDAVIFVDPIFSSGVYVAMASAELAAAEILAAFRDGRFRASRFADYERRFRRGTGHFIRFIEHYYDPAFIEIFLKPRNIAGMLDSVTGVLAGGAFVRIPLRMRLSLEVFFAIVRINRFVRRRRGIALESRLRW